MSVSGTSGSNPPCSSGESANFRSLSRSEIAELNFRIHSPPADSPSLAGIHLAFWRSRDFPRVSGPRVGGLVDRDAQDALIYAATAKYLCRAKFQYRSAADAGRDGSGTAAERGRVASGVGDRSRSFEFGAAQAKAERGPLLETERPVLSRRSSTSRCDQYPILAGRARNTKNHAGIPFKPTSCRSSRGLQMI